MERWTEKEHKAFQKLLIQANKCTIGEVYYLTGMWWDYGEILPIGVGRALVVAFGGDTGELENIAPVIRDRCLINTPVKFVGKVPAIERGLVGCRKGFEFEMPDGEKIHMYAKGQVFKEKYIQHGV